MKHTIAIFTTIALTVIMTGCGHNTVVYGDGLGFETTLNPETFTFGVNIRYGKILTAAVKEKTKLNFKGDLANETSAEAGESKTGASKLGSGTELSLETGDQITGYAVDLERVKNEGKKTETATVTPDKTVTAETSAATADKK